MKANPNVIDGLVVAYLGVMFTRGESTNTARLALCAILFMPSRARARPCSLARDESDVLEDPMPI